MKTLLRGLVAASLIATPAFANEPGSDLEKLSYSIGVVLNSQIEPFGELDFDQLVQGLRDARDAESQLSDAEIREIIAKAQADIRAKQREIAEQRAEQIKIAGEKYLTENARREGVTVTASGLQYEVIEAADGPMPASTDSVQVNYVGKLFSGEEFDSSYKRGSAAVFSLDQVIPGWSEGLQLMNVGSKYVFTVPPSLGYGESGAGDSQGNEIIPPNSVLVFEVELLAINPES